MRLVLVVFLLLLCSPAILALDSGENSRHAVNSETVAGPARIDKIEITESRIGKHYGREWMSIEVVLAIALLLLTAGLAGGVIYLAKTAQKAWSPQSLLRVLGIILIIPLAVILVVAGYSEDQIASVIGLMGVAVGYLLGSGEKPRQDT